MDLGLQDRSAFVAGGSSGLGRASALELLRAGCRVAIGSRSESRIREAARGLCEEAGVSEERVLPIVCDVMRDEDVARAIEETVGRFGGLNVLVTNAGGPRSGPFDDLGVDDFRQAVELNLVSAVRLCHYALPHLRRAAAEDGLARILMISSISAKQPIPNLMLSNTARAGVQGFARTLAEEVGAEGITVNTLLPGYTRTDRLTELIEAAQKRTGRSAEEIVQGYTEAASLQRLGEPHEFAAALAFLASARAGFITGVALPVDGGRSKGLL